MKKLLVRLPSGRLGSLEIDDELSLRCYLVCDVDSYRGKGTMPLLDVYGRTHELDAKSVDAIAARLEARRGSSKYMGMLQEYLEAIDLAAAQSILALGCGTGVEVREVLRRPDFRGRVTAIDISADLVERGKGLADQEGFAGRIEWLVGDAQELRLSDGAFDLV